MAAPIEFYFDFSSPYGYIASRRVDAIGAKFGREVTWRPFMLGAVFKVAGTLPLTQYPLKGEYSKHDFARTARLYDVPFNMPAKFPIATMAAARGFYWLEANQPAKAKPFARAAYQAYFADGCDISDPTVLSAVADESGVDAPTMLAGTQAPEIKERLKAVSAEAIERKVFGSPFLFVDGEPFWGADRLDMAERWLETGGW